MDWWIWHNEHIKLSIFKVSFLQKVKSHYLSSQCNKTKKCTHIIKFLAVGAYTHPQTNILRAESPSDIVLPIMVTDLWLLCHLIMTHIPSGIAACMLDIVLLLGTSVHERGSLFNCGIIQPNAMIYTHRVQFI